MNRRKVNVDARLGVGRFIGVIFETDPSIVRLRAEGNYQAIYDLAQGKDELLVLRLAAATAGLRWFFLIILYGVFIPCSWRRC